MRSWERKSDGRSKPNLSFRRGVGGKTGKTQSSWRTKESKWGGGKARRKRRSVSGEDTQERTVQRGKKKHGVKTGGIKACGDRLQ